MIPTPPVGPIEPSNPARSVIARLDDAAPLLPDLAQGQRVRARVEAQLADGSVAVRVGQQTLRMELPGPLQPGDLIELDFQSRVPRLQFATVPTEGAPASLSGGARLAAALMTHPGSGATMQAVNAGPPLPAALLSDPPALAQNLRDGVAQSGLFYESHLAAWVAGHHTLAQLRAEPQARLELKARPEPQSHPEPQDGLEPPPGPDAPRPRLPAELQALVHPASTPLVQQQLGVMDQGRLQLQLEVWPHQWMSWDIEQEPARDEPTATLPQADAPQHTWHSRLSMELPHLGRLEANLALCGDVLQVHLLADQDSSAAWLEQQRATLAQALRQAGLTPARIEVRQARHDGT